MDLIKKISISSIVILLLLIGLDKLYTFGLIYNVNIKASYIQTAKIDADVLIHGPCEPLWMISPKLLDKQTHLKSYNLALSHSDFADNYLHLFLYLKNNKAPNYLFLYVTPESMDTLYNTFNTFRFAPYAGDALVDSVLKSCDENYYNWSKFPFMKYAYYNSKINFNVLQGWKYYLTKSTKPYFEDGYEPPIQIKWDNHLEKFIQLYPHGYYFKWNSLREKYLRKIIELAQSKSCKVYLYESPVLKEALPLQPNRDEIIQKINAIALEYCVKYVQFDNMKIAESRQYFMSTLNTNLKGSAIFTDTLGKYIFNEFNN